MDGSDGVVVIDENAWFRELMRETLPEYGVTVLGAERSPGSAREVIVETGAPVLLCTVSLGDERCEGLFGLLSSLPERDVPAAVVLGDTFRPGGHILPGGCPRLGKNDGVAAVAAAIRNAAGERREFLRALNGEIGPERAVDIMLNGLGLSGALAGVDYLRRAAPMYAHGSTAAKEIYITLGRESGALPKSVERDIRFAVHDRVPKASVYVRRMLFGSDWERTPTNMALIARLGRAVGAAGFDGSPE